MDLKILSTTFSTRMDALKKENAFLKSKIDAYEKLYGLHGKIRELECENAALKAVLRCRNDGDEDNEYERPEGMSDKEFRAYVSFRNQRKDVYPDYYTEMTIAPVEESEWQQRLQEMREDGLWED